MIAAACYVWPHSSFYDATPPADDGARLLAVDLSANAFLPQMVRTIVGNLVAVGDGSWTVEQFASVLAQADRRLAAPTAPPQGLCLMRVWYP